MCIDTERFERARGRVIGIERQRLGIGTLSEKTVHAVLKNYYAPDEDMHEIPIENFVADIFDGEAVIEIQTRSFQNMRGRSLPGANRPRREMHTRHSSNCIRSGRF